MRGGEAGAQGDRHDVHREHHLQARRHRLLLAGRRRCAARTATSWCSAPSSARPSAPSARRASSAGTRSSWASTASYLDLIHKLGGPAMNGFYSTGTINYPVRGRRLEERARLVPANTRSKYKEDPNRVLGVRLPDHRRCSPVAREGRPEPERGHAGQGARQLHRPARHVRRRRADASRPTKHLGSNRAKLCQIQTGSGSAITDFMDH